MNHSQNSNPIFVFALCVCDCVQMRQLERTLTMRDLQLAESEQSLRELQFCTFDGVFIWKISDFSRRRQEALAGRAPAMFSPGTWTMYRKYTPANRRLLYVLCAYLCSCLDVTFSFVLTVQKTTFHSYFLFRNVSVCPWFE